MMQLEPNTNGSVPSLSNSQSLTDSSFVLSRFHLLTIADELPTNKPSTLCLSLDLSDAQSLTDSTFALYALVLVS